MRSVTLGNVLTPTKTAILVGVTKSDRALIAGQWRQALTLPHGSEVQESTHFNRHTSRCGEVVNARQIGAPSQVIRIDDIRIMDVKQMTPEEFQGVGYADYDAYMAHFGRAYGDKVWYMRISRPWWGRIARWLRIA